MLTSAIVGVPVLAIALLWHSSPGAEEILEVNACGFNPAVTAEKYSGLVEVTVSGVVTIVPPDNGHDGFYGLTGASDIRPTSFRFAPLTRSDCTCLLQDECPTGSFPVSSFALGPYPAFNPERSYTVLLDLGEATPDNLIFGIPDCGCRDNSGTLTVKVSTGRRRSDLDVDGNGKNDALTDGILILRSLFQFESDALIGGDVVAPDCTRCTAEEIGNFLDERVGD